MRRTIAIGRRLVMGMRRRAHAFGRFPAVAAKIGHVPACAFKLKTGCRYLFLIGVVAAFRANRQKRIRHFLQHVLSMTAGAAFVYINRHEKTPRKFV